MNTSQLSFFLNDDPFNLLRARPNVIHEGQTLYEGYVDMITGFNIRCWSVTSVEPGRVHLKRSICGCPIYEGRNIKEIGATIFLQVDQCIEAFK
jgi:hypothetical protein